LAGSTTQDAQEVLARAGAGGPSQPGRFLRRFDIGAKLFVAFCAVAGFTILAAILAFILFAEVRRNLTLVTDESLPEIVNSFRLAQESGRLSATITNVARAETQGELNREFGGALARLQAIDDLVESHFEHRDDPHVLVEDFERVVGEVRHSLEQLYAAVGRALEAHRHRERLVSDLFRDHRRFIESVDPLIDDAREQMIEASRRSVAEGTAGISSLIDDSFDALRAVLVVQSNVYLLISATYQAAATDQSDRVYDLRYGIVAPIAEIQGAFNQISDSDVADRLKQLSVAIIDAAIGRDGVFALKLARLKPASRNGAIQGGALPERLAALDQLQDAFKSVSAEAIALVDESILEAATKMSQEGQKIVDKTRQGIGQLETMLVLKSGVNELLGLISQGATAIDRDDIAALKQRYATVDDQVAELLVSVQLTGSGAAVRPAIRQVLSYGLGERSIFTVRDDELTAQDEAAALLRQGQLSAGELSASTQVFVDTAEHAASVASTATLDDLARGEDMLIAIAAISLTAVMLIAWLFVQRGIVRRLQALSATMLSIADGHLDDPIPRAKSDDEITDMAHALAVFRENAVKRRQAEQSLRVAKDRAETALQDLTAAQRRLVQSEKMASLGQLTAGIAHEIKNPLNFVNNFASLSRELIEELREQLEGVRDRVGPAASQEIDDIFGDLDLNLDKIGEHGKRADGIVRGMLDHSRESSHAVEATDINKLLEEYANLAYHGMRAQSTDFNVTIERDLDPHLQPIEVVTQDIGRVILNIISNAFQAIYQKSEEHGTDYDPKLCLSTRRRGDTVEIRISDNGPGMSEAVQAKIFQPFFTTKPTGEGTGLGLSISYDIVVQQHGGRLEVSATEGEGSEFLMVLPAGPTAAAQRTLHEQSP